MEANWNHSCSENSYKLEKTWKICFNQRIQFIWWNHCRSRVNHTWNPQLPNLITCSLFCKNIQIYLEASPNIKIQLKTKPQKHTLFLVIFIVLDFGPNYLKSSMSCWWIPRHMLAQTVPANSSPCFTMAL